jgi:hypothetical protein
MILCRKNTEEWVRWRSPIQMLLITVPDQTLHSVAEELGGKAPELNGTPLLKDERIRALVAPSAGACKAEGTIRCREGLGGLLKYYDRQAA